MEVFGNIALLLGLCLRVTEGADIYFGMLTPIGTPNEQMYGPVQLALNDINNHPEVLSGHTLRLVIKNTSVPAKESVYHVGNAVAKLQDLMTSKTDPPVMALLHYGSITETDVIGEITGKLKMTQISTGSSSTILSQRLVFPYLYRTIGALLDVINIEVDFVERFGWTRVALLAEDKRSFTEMSKEVEILLRQSGIEIVTSVFYRVEQLGQVMEKLKELDARVIMHHSNKQGSSLCHVFCQAYKYGLIGKKYVWLTLVQHVKDYRNLASNMHQKGQLSCNAEQVVQAAEGQFIIFRAEAKHASEVGYEPIRPFTVKDHAEILREMKEQAWFNDDTRRILYQVNYDAIWAAALALNKSLPHIPPRVITNFKYTDLGTVTDALVPEMNRTNFFGASGPVSFSPHGSRMSWLSMEQIRNGTAILFGIYDQKSRNITLSGKISDLWYSHGGSIPQSGYRTVRKVLVVTDELKITFTVIAVISIVITVVFLLVTIVKWKTQYVLEPVLAEMRTPNCH
ncbi:gamma-aminobutyric acid type B receptor subunit 1-like [Lingula anatina]|uniref:Gamma-aminobutyric acid type B receptor subunit 1-like n=1 Tax=Lingula anatina TaxID=7574 RepID=A0A1S3HGP3_LINAN|nr:gamma-aminobutyric acid type B receptor subunit 1-like [Lingula anatina]|eukprot:XP_013384646.1 gamma-aminobutyric acid type B receptor subunit 1-like [Lingula anatina]